MKKFRVIIVEDDSALRLSLTDWLSKDYLVSNYESAEALLKAIHNSEFEDDIATCILLDFQMPGISGVELQTQLQKMSIQYSVIFMSGNAMQTDIIDAWHGGAVDFILKPFSGTKLSEMLAALFDKASVSESSVVRTLPISQREAEVLLLLGEGHRQHEIAEMLHVTLRTIKWHRSNIKDKLYLNTLVEIARYCDEHRYSIECIAKGI